MYRTVIISAILILTGAIVFFMALVKVLESNGEIEVDMKLAKGEFRIKKKGER